MVPGRPPHRIDSTAAGRAEIYLLTPEGGAARRITSGDSSDVRPSWSHDGAWIYFGSNRGGAWGIWRIASDTPQPVPVQVTHDGSREAFEDPGGTFLYYTKEPPTRGIWRMPLPAGSPERVSEEGVQGQWTIGRRGLYYLNGWNQLELMQLPTGTRLPIPAPGLRMSIGSGGLVAIAPDDRWLLVTVDIRSESDLTLVENFR